MAEPLLSGSHTDRPVSGLKPAALYLCETHRLVYQTVDGGRSWATWGTLVAGAPSTHATSHQDGGSDEIDVTGLTGAGGGGTTVLTANIAFNTAGLNNPGDAGAEILTLPANRLCRVTLIPTISWDQDGDLAISVGQNAATASVQVLDVRLPVINADAYAASAHDEPRGNYAATPDTDTIQAMLRRQTRPFITLQESKLCAAFFPDGTDPTAGAATVICELIPLS